MLIISMNVPEYKYLLYFQVSWSSLTIKLIKSQVNSLGLTSLSPEML